MSSFLRNASIVFLAMWFASCSKQDIGQTDDGTFVTGSVEQSATTERGISPGARSIVIDGYSGNIQIAGTMSESANFVLTKRARSSDAESAAKLIDKISIEEAGDEATFTLSMSSPEEERTAVDIEATIPVGTPIVVKYTAGSISLRNLNGNIKVSNTAGSIDYLGASASLELQTRNGDVQALLTDPAQLATGRLETSNGDIMVAIPTATSLGVDATTSSGAVRNANLTFNSRSLSTNGAGSHFKGQIGSANKASLIAKTYHGDISFRILDAAEITMPVEEAMPDAMEADTVDNPVIANDVDSTAALSVPADSTVIEYPE